MVKRDWAWRAEAGEFSFSTLMGKRRKINNSVLHSFLYFLYWRNVDFCRRDGIKARESFGEAHPEIVTYACRRLASPKLRRVCSLAIGQLIRAESSESSRHHFCHELCVPVLKMAAVSRRHGEEAQALQGPIRAGCWGERLGALQCPCGQCKGEWRWSAAAAISLKKKVICNFEGRSVITSNSH